MTVNFSYMKSPFVILACLALLLSKGLQAQQLTLSPQKPVVGKTLQVQYSPQGSSLQAGVPVLGEALLYQNYSWTRVDLPLESKGNLYQGQLLIPAPTAFVAFRFFQGSPFRPDQLDIQKSYGLTTVSSTGQTLPGGALASVIFQMPTLDSHMPFFWNDMQPALSTEILQKALQTELKEPARVKHFIPTYLTMQKAILGKSFTQQAPALLAKLEAIPDLSEADRMELARYYRYDLKDKTRADQIEQSVIQGNPTGPYARLAASHELIGAKSREQMISKSESFLKKFPYGEWKKNSTNQAFIYYEVHRNLATAYFETRQFGPLLALLPQLDFKTTNEIARWNIHRAFTFKMLPLDSINLISTPFIKHLIQNVKDSSFEEPNVFTAKDAQIQAANQLDERLYIHLSLLHELGKDQEAESYFNHFSEKGKYANAEFNETYLQILEKTGSPIQSFLESCAKANALTPLMLEKLQSEFVKKKGSADGFQTYLSSLKSDEGKAELETYVKQHLLNEEIMPFALENPEGKLVRSSDWEDKIVVIDFWATWCKPCISAFPGMQIAVDKYAKDPEVAFYFVGTMQHDNYKEKSEGYIKKMGYRFNLLHDGINKKTGEQNAVFSTLAPRFNSSGIPRKIVLKNGMMRYSSEGYSGSPSKLVDELSTVIEILKSEK
ncbi:thiol-disulfide isomerase/thioredoxin [Siphonobacter sp. BAB-5404]|nr:thiol-disulfide isomerase/thioredoxin [Siphonobacter sp. SORGH_AS_0500]